MNLKEFVKNYLSFTRKERIAVVIITVLIVLVLLTPKIISVTSPDKPITTDTSWIAAIKKLEIKQGDSITVKDKSDENDNYAYQYDRTKSRYEKENSFAGKPFYFDPNNTSATDWNRLGLRDKTIQTIQNYLSKGGKFRKPEDLQRIYGLKNNEFERLLPYIRIEAAPESKPAGTFTTATTENPEIKSYASRYSVIDINTADTSAFISLPGIGSKLASRIVNFRDKLGGFYTIEQVKETFGLPDSTYQKIKQWLKLDNPLVKKININTATVDELKAHPYIKYSLANPIVAYRNEHGPFAKVEDVKKVMAVTEDIYRKVSPYLLTQ